MQKYMMLLIIFMEVVFAEPIMSQSDIVGDLQKGELFTKYPIVIVNSTPIRSNPIYGGSHTKIGIVNIEDKHIGTLELSKAPNRFKIKIKNAFHLPNILTIQRGDTTIKSIKSRISRSVSFKMNKSDLLVGDRLIIRSNDSKIVVDMNISK